MDIGAATEGGENGVGQPPSPTPPSIDSQHSEPAEQLMDIGAATEGGENGVGQMDLDQNEVPDVTRPSRSTRSRKNHPINEHSKSLSTSTSKKGRSRPPAIADQTLLSQKRVEMDESLNILVVCTFPPFFFEFRLNMNSRKMYKWAHSRTVTQKRFTWVNR
jgi:hypothetical protein